MGIWRRLTLYSFGVTALYIWPHTVSFAQNSYSIMNLQTIQLGQLGSYIQDSQQSSELNKMIQQFNDTYKTNRWLKSILYFVDLSKLDLDSNSQHIAILDYANSDYLQIYRPNANGKHTTVTLGDELPIKPIQARYRLPTIDLNPNGYLPNYLVIQALDTIQTKFDVLIDDSKAFDKRVQQGQLNYGLLFGAIITLSIYNLILFFFTRERSYFWYSSYLTCMVFLLLTNNGLGQLLIWPEASGVTTKIGFISTGGLIVTMSLFISSFINLKNGFQVNNLITKVVMLATSICMLSSLWLYHGAIDNVYFVLASVQMINILIIAYIAFRQKQVASIYLFLGYLILFPAIGISILKFSGTLGSTFLTNHAIEASLLIEAFILSVGVGEKIRQIKTKQFIAVDELRSSKQNFLRTLINEREREKKEFGVVLHNSVVQNLAVLRTKLNHSPSAFEDNRESIIEVVDNTIDDVREISHQSFPHILEQFGLAEAAKNYAESNLDTREIDWSCDVDDSRLNKDQSLTLYRIIQESINNTYRHADASKVSISLQFNKGQHQLNIQDDGLGFDQIEEGFGFSLIKQYALHLEGVAQIASAPNSGTRTTVQF